MKKKLITAGVLLLSASLLVAASILGTLAFLASSSAVSNTFTYGEVGIRMLESKVDEDGKDADDDRTVDGNSYKLIPNKTYTKDPAITVTKGSVPSYLFVKVKNGISTIEKADGNTMKDQMIVNGWQAVKSNDAGEVLYLYVGAGNASADIVTDPATVNADPVGKADADEVIEIFKQLTVSEGAPVADYAGAKVTLTAFAIQTEGFTETTDGLVGYQLAWNAIVGRFPFESGTQFVAAGTP